MKKLTLSLVVFLAVCQFSYGQWTQADPNTVFSYTGNVGIGTSNLSAKFTVYQAAQLGTAIKSNTLLTSINGSAFNNVFKNNLWLVRNATGSDWQTSRLHDGISIDGTFLTPQTDTRTWWERDPSADVQSWGTAANTYLTIKQGNVGIGTTAPNEKLVVTGNIKAVLEPAFPTKNNVRITTLGFSGPTGAVNWAIRGVYQHGGGVNLNADGGDLDIIKSLDGNTILGTKTDGTALGNVAIGTTDPKGYKLAVNGSVIATSMTVKLYANWPDYVFKKDYQLPSLQEVKTYIDQNQHLPEIPSAQEIAKDGLNLGEMNKLLMKKVEELTLYLIRNEEEKAIQEKTNRQLQKQIGDLKFQLESLVKMASQK